MKISNTLIKIVLFVACLAVCPTFAYGNTPDKIKDKKTKTEKKSNDKDARKGIHGGGFDRPPGGGNNGGGGNGGGHRPTTPIDTTATEGEGMNNSLLTLDFGVHETVKPEEKIIINPIYTARAVDLGLSVLWADSNLGASSPEELGNYYAWGEIKPKTSFTWENYLDGSIAKKVDCGTDKDILKDYVYPYGRDLSVRYDAATMSLGLGWRMPTKAELKQLELQCEWKWTERDGVAGHIITGPNGNSIFLPATGWAEGDRHPNVGLEGYYWASTASVAFAESAYMLSTSEFDVIAGNTDVRYNGFTIRPVKVKQQ